jgi:hypothetical protein
MQSIARSFHLKKVLILVFPIMLIACTGGGSSTSSTSSPSISPFTSWSNVAVGAPVSFSGGSSSTLAIDGTSFQGESDGAATLILNSSNNFSVITASTTANSVTFSSAAGDNLQSGFSGLATVALNKSQTTVGIFSNPISYGFEYQTFGAWGAYGNATTPAYAISVGNPSPSNAIPLTGAVTFTGGAAGYYVDPAKFAYVTNANMVAAVTFNTRSVAFSTTNTSIAGGPGTSQLSVPALNMTGTLSYAAGTNSMAGTATTSNGMSGNMNGKFYGPGINEIGGTYAVTGSGIGSMVGGFGGKR